MYIYIYTQSQKYEIKKLRKFNPWGYFYPLIAYPLKKGIEIQTALSIF